MKLSSIALPAISSGIFGFPKPLCAQIMVSAGNTYRIQFEEALKFCKEYPDSTLKEIRFTNFDSPVCLALLLT